MNLSADARKPSFDDLQWGTQTATEESTDARLNPSLSLFNFLRANNTTAGEATLSEDHLSLHSSLKTSRGTNITAARRPQGDTFNGPHQILTHQPPEGKEITTTARRHTF